MPSTELITDIEIYRRVLLEGVIRARKFLWIGTSDLKDLYVEKAKGMVPFLEILSDLIKQGVSVRLIHAKEPGPNFRKDFDRYPALIKGLERLHCPRVHFKSVIVDGIWAYTGSANLTGAGMGAKSSDRRNFEAGIITTEKEFIRQIMEQFDSLWMGSHCRKCGHKDVCTEYGDMIQD
jgi:phosphatidylserine/phosphatidylglycerophosphate/cardiolipin synthase-like enzyme